MHAYYASIITIIEIPTIPRNLRSYDTNSDGVCAGGPRIQFDWQHPENHDRTVLSHYEYIFNNQTKNIQRTSALTPYSPVYLVGMMYTFEIYYFEVYAVDICGRKSEHAVTTYPPITTTKSSSWWPF